MKVAVYYANDDVRIEERPRPEPGPGELLLRVRASGICGSDVMEWYRAPRAPSVLGHEVAGVVEAVGGDVEDFRPGDRVVSTHHVPCQRCRYCLTGRQSVCPTLRSTHFDPGGFAEFVRVPAANVRFGTFPLPESVSFEEGSFVEPLACALRAQHLCGIRPGDSVAVLGSGVAGILHIQLARALGAGPIVATDVHPYRLEAARRFGADAALDAREARLAERVRDGLGGRGAEHVLVCAGAVEALEQALEIVDPGGHVLVFAPTPPEVRLPLPVFRLWRDGVALLQSYAGPPAEMLRALDLLAARRVDVASMITHRLPLERIAQGFRMAARPGEHLKIVVTNA